MKFVKKVFSSPLGIALYAINFGLLLLCVTQTRGLTGQQIDAHPLHPLFFFLILLNYMFSRPLTYFVDYIGLQPTNMRDAGIFAIVSIQWLFIGFLIEAAFRKIAKGR